MPADCLCAARPELKTRDFYVTGESYGGHYIPVVSHHVWRTNKAKPEGERINLAGMAIGNGLCARNPDPNTNPNLNPSPDPDPDPDLEQLINADAGKAHREHVTVRLLQACVAGASCMSCGRPGLAATEVDQSCHIRSAKLRPEVSINTKPIFSSVQDGPRGPIRRLQRLRQAEGAHHGRPGCGVAAGAPHDLDRPPLTHRLRCASQRQYVSTMSRQLPCKCMPCYAWFRG